MGIAEPETANRGAGRWVTVVTLVAVVVIWVGFVLAVAAIPHGSGPAVIDLQVYRAGGHAVLAGHSLYAPDFAELNNSPSGLHFTYPPFSALIFAPLAMVPMAVAQVVMALLSLIASAALFSIVIAAAARRWERLSSWRSVMAPVSVKTGALVFVSALIFMFSVPVMSNFTYGQINIILCAAIAADVLLPRVWWPRGLLVSLAAAVKLTPAAFFAYFLFTRQWRALAVSVASAVAAVAVSWLVMPADTVQYFRSTIFDPERIGGLAYASNQSIRGVIERIPALDSIGGLVWIIATMGVLALTVVAVEASRRRRDTVATMLSVAMAALLCSPVSWGHHWVWLPVAAIYFLVRWSEFGGVRSLLAGLALAAVSVAAPWALLPNANDLERLWNPAEHVLGAAWAIAALGLLVWFATAGLRPQIGSPVCVSRSPRSGQAQIRQPT